MKPTHRPPPSLLHSLSFVLYPLSFALCLAALAQTPLAWSVRFADSRVAALAPAKRFNAESGASWDYANFLFLNSLLNLDTRLGQPRYLDFVRRTADSFITANADGSVTIAKYKLEDYNIDFIAPGRAIETLYKTTKDARYLAAIKILRHQFTVHPRTSEGGFWHKKIYPHQMWLDGLFMGAPFYTDYAANFAPASEKRAAFDDIAYQILLIDKHAYDAKTGLYYHGWDSSHAQPWADKTTGLSPNFWSRAIGWYGMALVDVLDNFPADHPARPKITAILQKLADGIVKHQDPTTGLWWQVTDQGTREGNYLEATASCMFTYTLAKAINNNWLSDRAAFHAAAEKAWNGILKHFIRENPDGSLVLTQCCKVAGLGPGNKRDGSFAYYISEPIVNNDNKGTGPFVFAGIEMDRLLKIDTPATSIPPPPDFRYGAKTIDKSSSIQNPKSKTKSSDDPWLSVYPAILARIKPPAFPDRVYPITNYGASADGKSDASAAIRAAIDACAAGGGGTVLIPAGTWLTGPIHLKSNTNLHLEEGATLQFIPDPRLYQPNVFTRWEGVELMNFSPLIYAYEQQNIAITGKGILDGAADYDNWWGWVLLDRKTKPKEPLARASRNRLMREAQMPIEQQDPRQRIYGLHEYIRPPFIQPYRCQNILIEGVTILRSPFWEINPVLCRNVTIRGVTIVSHGANNDGCDPESCTDVLIENTSFDTGDDCIAIKSGRNNDGRRVNVPSENIIIRNCTFKDGHGGVTIGSEISGGCRNVFIENCEMDSPRLDRALRFKTNAVRGGVIENIHARNIRVGRVADAVIHADFNYEEGARGDHIPVLRNVVIENLTSKSSARAITLRGLEKAPISDITVRNCQFGGVKKDNLIEHVQNLRQENVKIERTSDVGK